MLNSRGSRLHPVHRAALSSRFELPTSDGIKFSNHVFPDRQGTARFANKVAPVMRMISAIGGGILSSSTFFEQWTCRGEHVAIPAFHPFKFPRRVPHLHSWLTRRMAYYSTLSCFAPVMMSPLRS